MSVLINMSDWLIIISQKIRATPNTGGTKAGFIWAVPYKVDS